MYLDDLIKYNWIHREHATLNGFKKKCIKKRMKSISAMNEPDVNPKTAHAAYSVPKEFVYGSKKTDAPQMMRFNM